MFKNNKPKGHQPQNSSSSRRSKTGHDSSANPDKASPKEPGAAGVGKLNSSGSRPNAGPASLPFGMPSHPVQPRPSKPRPNTQLVDDARKNLSEGGKIKVSVRTICKHLGMSPKVVLRCIHKLDRRLPRSEKQTAYKGAFNQKTFRGLTLIFLIELLEGNLDEEEIEYFAQSLLEMLRKLPEYAKIIRESRIPVVIEDD